MLRAVSKFGGSSVADAACVSRVVSLIKAPPADRTRQHVVVSAPGKRTLPGGAADCYTVSEATEIGGVPHRVAG